MLLDETVWTDNVLLGGRWTAGGAGVPRRRRAGDRGRARPRSAWPRRSDVAKAAESAARAQREWAALPHVERAAVLRRAARCGPSTPTRSRWWNVREVGAVPGMAGFAVHVAEQECYEAAALPSRPYGELLPSEQPAAVAWRGGCPSASSASSRRSTSRSSSASVRSRPRSPSATPSSSSPTRAPRSPAAWCMARIFEEAGLPAGVLQMLPGRRRRRRGAGRPIPLVRVISFTGSTAAGRRVGELAGKHLKRAHLELGGNSALIVLDDADVDAAVNLAAWGSFFHQGQICMTTGRHLVHDAAVRRVRRGARREGGARCRSATRRRARSRSGPLIDAGPARQGARPGDGERRRRAQRSPPAAPTTGCSTRRPC